MQKLLFVCSRNRRRSLTAETVFRDESNYQVRSAGTEVNARNKLTPGLLGWADMVFVMEPKHREWIWQRYRDLVADTPIICLLIADEYTYMDEELIELLTNRVATHLAEE